MVGIPAGQGMWSLAVHYLKHIQPQLPAQYFLAREHMQEFWHNPLPVLRRGLPCGVDRGTVRLFQTLVRPLAGAEKAALRPHLSIQMNRAAVFAAALFSIASAHGLGI